MPCPANDTHAEGLQERRARQEQEARAEAVAPPSRTGAKYQSGRRVAETAKLVRADLRALASAAPSVLYGCAFAVRSDRSSTHSSIDVEVTPPAGVSVVALARARQEALRPHDRHRSDQHSPRGKAILEAVEAVLATYNRDGGGSNVAFYAAVRFASGVEAAELADVADVLRRLGPPATATA